MTSTEITLILMDDLLIVMDEKESALYEELAKNFEDPKLSYLQAGAKSAFVSIKTTIAELKEMAIRAQMNSNGVGQA